MNTELIRRRNKPSLHIETKINQYCPRRDFLIKCTAISLILLINVLLLVFDWYFKITYLYVCIALRTIIAGYYSCILIWMDFDTYYPTVICTFVSTLNLILLQIEVIQAIV